MTHTKIKVGMLLRLKKERAEAYGLPIGSIVKVERIKDRPGYSVPWIIAGNGAFKPSDFSCAV